MELVFDGIDVPDTPGVAFRSGDAIPLPPMSVSFIVMTLPHNNACDAWRR
jgi:hypothetical protein